MYAMKGLRFSFNKTLISQKDFKILPRLSHQLVLDNKETCLYPPIVDMSKEGQQRHERQLWYDSIKALPTVEQKLYELTLHHKHREKRFLISGLANTYNEVFFHRYITRTHLINHLPEKVTNLDVDKEYEQIADVLKETILLYYFNNWKCQDDNYRDPMNKNADSSQLVNYLIAHCNKKLSLRNDYILDSTVQQNPRLNSYWFHQGFESKIDTIYQKNLTFQFKDVPSFVIRIRKPLNPILDLNDPLCATAEVPDYHYHPLSVGLNFDKKWITSVPGHWFDDPCEYPFLLVQTTEYMHKLLSKLQFYDIEEIKNSMGLMYLFGWLNAVATYQGFTPFHDLTYPLVAQAIFTNGRDWNFFVYQLNTIAFHEDVDKKDRRNLCWSSGNMRLFDEIEDGQFKGFNDEVFKVMLKLLFNGPMPQENVVYKPYLGEANMDVEEFNSMRYFYRRMYSQAPDPMAFKHEIPTWQKIYVYSKHAKPMPFVKME